MSFDLSGTTEVGPQACTWFLPPTEISAPGTVYSLITPSCHSPKRLELSSVNQIALPLSAAIDERPELDVGILYSSKMLDAGSKDPI